jgi:hypothetical protein
MEKQEERLATSDSTPAVMSFLYYHFNMKNHQAL